MDKPRTFEHFPDDVKCPVCLTSKDAECLLIPIDGTHKERIAQAIPVHLWCAVATNYNKEMKVFYRRAGDD